ncbi:hypothetical protein EXU34_15870 [Alteromonas sp. ZYF713]|nr:hypothetical protein [Alteromonas sp. ZYF713]
MRREVSKQQQLTRLGIAFVIFLLSSIYHYHRDEAQAASINSMFNDTVFGIPNVSTKLNFYSDTHEQLSIKITASGLPEPAREYKPHLLAFVCSQPSLKAILRAGKPIHFDMSAPDRSEGRHVNMQIDAARCHYSD